MRRINRWPAVVLLLSLSLPAAAKDADFEALFRDYEFERISLSPDGTFVAFERGNEFYAGNPSTGFSVLHRLGKGSSFESWVWVDDRTLFLEIQRANGNELYRAIRLGVDATSGELSIERKNHAVNGYVHDSLEDQPGRLRFAKFRTGQRGRQVDLFEFDVFAKTSDAFRRANRVKVGKVNARELIDDASGEVLSGIAYDGDENEYVFWRRDDRGRWQEAWRYDQNFFFRPLNTRDNGAVVLALTNLHTPKYALVEINAGDGSLRRIVQQSPYHNLTSASFADDGITLNDVFLSGVPVSEARPVNPVLADALSGLQAARDDELLSLLDYSRDFDTLLVRTVSNTHPGRVELCQASSGSCRLVGSKAPWLDDIELAASTVIEGFEDEGLQFQPTLQKPARTGPRVPVIVMPYDLRMQNHHPQAFDDGILALLQDGYAVLQLSYTKADDEVPANTTQAEEWLDSVAGRIRQQVEAALSAHPDLDATRMCSWSTGLDAFVAIDSAIRQSGFMPCVTVFDPVTDLTLLMQEPQVSSQLNMQQRAAEMLPVDAMSTNELVAASVLYRDNSLMNNIYLSSGRNNNAIDVEHTWRLFQVLKLRGALIEMTEYDEEGASERDRQMNRYFLFLEYLKERSEIITGEEIAQLH